jgi:nucleoside permease NupC
MRTLGKGISGGVTTGVSRVGGMTMSGLGAGLGVGAAFMGLQGIGSIFDKLLAVSPELNAAMTRLKVAIGDALVPVAFKLAEFLNQLMPTIEAGLKTFGDALADAIQFWTEDAFDPAVWKDIGTAIAESVSTAVRELIPQAREGVTGTVESVTGSGTAGQIAGALYDLNPIVLQQQLASYLFNLAFGSADEGANSL